MVKKGKGSGENIQINKNNKKINSGHDMRKRKPW